MRYDWVTAQILNQDLSDAVTAIVAQGKDEIIDALRAGTVADLPCGHGVAFADDTTGAKCLLCEAQKLGYLWETRYDVVSAQNRALQKALKAIANHGSGLPRTVAQLALKDLDRA